MGFRPDKNMIKCLFPPENMIVVVVFFLILFEWVYPRESMDGKSMTNVHSQILSKK